MYCVYEDSIPKHGIKPVIKAEKKPLNPRLSGSIYENKIKATIKLIQTLLLLSSQFSLPQL